MVFSIKTPNPGDSRKSFFGLDLARELTKKKTQTPELGISAEASNYNIIYGQIPDSATVDSILPYEATLVTGESWWAPESTNYTHLSRNRTVKCFRFNEVVAGPTLREWGIALDPISKTQAGRILMNGVEWLDTTSLGTLVPTATHINIVNNALVQGYNGRACVLQTPTKPHCLVDLSGHRGTLMGKTKTAGLAPGVEGIVWYRKPSATGWTVTTIEIAAWTDVSAILGDKLVRLDPIEGRYVAVELC